MLFPQQIVSELMVVCGKVATLSRSLLPLEQGHGAFNLSPHKLILEKDRTKRVVNGARSKKKNDVAQGSHEYSLIDVWGSHE